MPEIQFTWDVFGCCTCQKPFHYEREFARHARTQACLNATYVRSQVSGVIDIPRQAFPAEQVPNKLKPGPKGYDPAPALRGKLPLFTYHFNKRVNYLFDNPHILRFLIGPESCENQDPNTRAGFWLLALYGANAPKEFQSIVCHRSQVYYTVENSDGDDGLKYESEALTKQFKKRVMVDVMKLMKCVAESILVRCPKWRISALQVLDWLTDNLEKRMSLFESYTDRLDEYKYLRNNMRYLPGVRRDVEKIFGEAFDSLTTRNPRIPCQETAVAP